MSSLPGFNGYYLIAAGNGVISFVSLFDTASHAEELTRVVSSWMREERLETALPNPPQITTGEIVVHRTRELVEA